LNAPAAFRSASNGLHPELWRDASCYPAATINDMRRWAGEFLVRNPQFQVALEELRALWDVTRADSKALAAAKSDAPSSPYRSLAREIAERFGLTSWWQIQFRDSKPLIYPSFKVAPYWLHTRRLKDVPGEWFVGRDDGWGAALVFDLRKPLKPQLAVAEKMLKGTARLGVKPMAGVQRDRKANYQAMLRILDARAQRAPWREIAATLFPRLDEGIALERSKGLYDQARRLRDSGYVHLASLQRRWEGALIRPR
jgi:hypothetical protein